MAYKDFKSLPDFFKHVTMSIYEDMHGSPKERFQSALNIARSRLTEYGFLASGSESGGVENIRFTPRGARRVQEHQAEGRFKSKSFDQMTRLLTEEKQSPTKVEEKPGRPKPPLKEERDSLKKTTSPTRSEPRTPARRTQAPKISRTPKVKRAKRA